MTYKKHVKISFASDFSRDAREGNIRLEDIAEPIEILPQGIMFCEYAEKCNKICFKKKDEYCGIRNYYDRKQRAEEKGYFWN